MGDSRMQERIRAFLKNATRRMAAGSIALLLLGSLFPPGFLEAGQWAEPEKVAEVLSGTRKEACASWWGFDPKDSTEYLQAAIDSGAEKLTVPLMESDWAVRPIKIQRENLEVLFEPGVVIKAKRGPWGEGDCLFLLFDCRNIILNGYGAAFRMWREDYTRSPYTRNAHRHVILIRAGENIKISGLSLEEGGGDGIEIAGIWREWETYAKDVVIRDVVIDSHFRQGISVISAENLLIENVVVRNIAGTGPGAAVCIEPFRAEQRLVNIVLRNVTTENNALAGFFLFMHFLKEDSIPVSIRFENCLSVNDFRGIYIRRMGRNKVQGKVEFENIVVEDSRKHALEIDDKWIDNAEVVFENCVFRGSRLEPLRFTGGENWGGISFIDCVVEDWAERPAISLRDAGGISSLSGQILLRSPYAMRSQALNSNLQALNESGLSVRQEKGDASRPLVVREEAMNLAPVSSAGPEDAPVPLRINNSQLYALYADRGEEVRLEVEAGLNSYYEVEIVDPSGDVKEWFSANRAGAKSFHFTAMETGVHMVGIASPYPGNTLRVHSRSRLSLLPHSDMAVEQDVHRSPYVAEPGDLYFWVPDGVNKFDIKVMGWGNRKMKAVLFDAEGLLAAEMDNIPGRNWEAFSIDRGDSSEGEIWRISFETASDGSSFGGLLQLYKPIPPVVSFHPDALLIPAGDM